MEVIWRAFTIIQIVYTSPCASAFTGRGQLFMSHVGTIITNSRNSTESNIMLIICVLLIRGKYSARFDAEYSLIFVGKQRNILYSRWGATLWGCVFPRVHCLPFPYKRSGRLSRHIGIAICTDTLANIVMLHCSLSIVSRDIPSA